MPSSFGDAPTKAITDAIAAADYGKNGAPFGELLIRVCPSKHFGVVWWYNDAALFLWNPPKDYSSKFLPLGGWAGKEHDDPRPLLFAMTDDAARAPVPALAHPTDFEWRTDDGGSGNGNDMNFWLPIAPEGYQAMGFVFCFIKPDPTSYWCVRNDLCLNVTIGDTPDWHVYQEDKGAHSHFEMSLYQPRLTYEALGAVQNGKVLIPAPTFFAPNVVPQPGQPHAFNPCALQLWGCLLPVTPIPPQQPVFIPGGGEQPAQYEMGLASVVVVPYTALVNDPIIDQPDRSPFYYYAAQPYYASLTNDPGGTVVEIRITIGLSATDSANFTRSASLQLGADVGGKFGGLDAKFSASVTATLTLDTSASETTSTEVTITETITLPQAQRVYLWQQTLNITPFRQDGTQMLGAVYRNRGTTTTQTTP